MKKIFEDKKIINGTCLILSFFILLTSLIIVADVFISNRVLDLDFIHGSGHVTGNVGILGFDGNLLFGLGLIFFLLIILVLILNIYKFFNKNCKKIYDNMLNIIQIITSLLYGIISFIILWGFQFKPDKTICSFNEFFDETISTSFLPYCTEYRLNIGGVIVLVFVIVLFAISVLSLIYTNKKKEKSEK